MNENLKSLEAALVDAQTPIQVIDALNALANYLIDRDTSRGLELAAAAADHARIEGYKPGLIVALGIQMQCNFSLGRYDKTLETGSIISSLADEVSDQKQLAVLWRTLGATYDFLGDYQQSLAYRLKALKLYEQLEDQTRMAQSIANIGMVYSKLGDSQRAIEYYQRSIALARKAQSVQIEAVALNSCCVDYAKLGEYEKAVQSGEQALHLLMQLNDTYGCGVAWSSLGEVALASQNYAKAIEYFEQALPLFRTRDPDAKSQEMIETQINLARAYQLIGRPEKALTGIQAVLTHAESQNILTFMMQCYQLLSEIYEQQGDLTSALKHLRRYTEIRERILNETSQRELHNLQIIHETQRAQAESDNLRKLREQDRENFERLTQIKDDFLYHITHDMKSPLAVINTSTRLLTERIAPDDRLSREYINLIGTCIEKLQKMTEGILELAKMEATPALDIEPVMLSRWFDSILYGFKTLATFKRIELTMKVQPPDLIYRFDKLRLGQAIENLLSNAIKYTPAGGHIQLRAHCAELGLHIQVEDDGPGIPEDALPHVFDRFYRVSKYGEGTEGTGLGLSIAKLVVEQHGGNISVKTQVGQGATFSILLPVGNQAVISSAKPSLGR